MIDISHKNKGMTKAIFSLVFISFCISISAQEKVQIFSGGLEHFRFENGSLIFKKDTNIGIGDSTLFNSSGLSFSLAVGNWAGKSNASGVNNTFVGNHSGVTNNNGSSNTFLGFHSGFSNIDANSNTFVGSNSGYANSSGYSNTSLGAQSMQNSVSGYENVTIGYLSMLNNTTGYRNVAIGAESVRLGNNTNSIAIGYKSLYSGNSINAIAIGEEAMLNGSAEESIAIGTRALSIDTFSIGNIAIGYESGKNNSTGQSNVFLGYLSGWVNSSGGNNTFIGYKTGFLNQTGGNNTLIGNLAGVNCNSSNNTLIGSNSGFFLSTGHTNIAVGNFSLSNNISGNSNISMGNLSLSGVTSSSENIAIGHGALQSINTNGNTAIGHEAGFSTTSNSNVFVGYESGKNLVGGGWNTFVGYQSGTSSSGTDNTFLGYKAGLQSSGSNNAFVGVSAGSGTTTGSSNVALGAYAFTSGGVGSSNTVVGYLAMGGTSNGNTNTALGYTAGYSASGSGNVFLGHQAGHSSSGSNELYIDNTFTNDPLIYGNFATDEVGINGKLGIGTELPSQRLHVKDGNIKLENGNLFVDNSNKILFENSSGVLTNSAEFYIGPSNNLILASFTGEAMGFYTAPTAGSTAPPRLIINEDGQLRIPHVADAGLSTNGDLMIGSSASTSLVFDQNEIMARSGADGAPLYLQNDEGNIGINSQGFAPASTLHIRHPNTGDALSGIRIQNNTSAQHWTIRTRSTSPGDLTLYSDNGGNSSWVGEFDAVSGAYSATSDERLKKDILPLQSVLSTLLLLNPTTYQFKSQKESDTKRYIGLLAQDVAQYFPEAVRYDNEADLYHMNYDVFGVLAIKAIQEIQHENELLKAQLEMINERLKRLEEK